MIECRQWPAPAEWLQHKLSSGRVPAGCCNATGVPAGKRRPAVFARSVYLRRCNCLVSVISVEDYANCAAAANQHLCLLMQHPLSLQTFSNVKNSAYFNPTQDLTSLFTGGGRCGLGADCMPGSHTSKGTPTQSQHQHKQFASVASTNTLMCGGQLQLFAALCEILSYLVPNTADPPSKAATAQRTHHKVKYAVMRMYTRS